MARGTRAQLVGLSISTFAIVLFLSLLIFLLRLDPSGQKGLIGLLYSQISENKLLNQIFDDLLSEDGSEIYLKPVEVYLRLDQPVDFYTATEAARRKGEVALGYRKLSSRSDRKANYGVTLKPPKDHVTTFAPGDLLIVLAADYSHSSN